MPTVCLVESLTGGPVDATLNHRLKGAVKPTLTVSMARAAAELRAVIDSDDIVDPVVVATAAEHNAPIVSSDPDLATLANHVDPPVRVVDPASI